MKFSIIITIVVFFFLSANCQSQNNIDLYLYKKDGKLGLINRKGEIKLEANYSHIGKFKEGKAAITITTRAKNNYHKILNTKLGYINEEGEVVIPLKFQHIPDKIKDFSEGMAVIKINNKYGYINSDGKIVIQPKYSSAFPFSEGYAVVEFNGDYWDKALIDKNGKVAFSFLEKYREQVDSTAKSILVTTNQLSEDKIAVHTFIRGGKTISSVFNSKGELLFTKQLARINPYKNGNSIAIKDGCRVGSANCCIIIDDQGNVLTKASYYPLERIKSEYFLAEDATTGNQQVINSKGDRLQPLIKEGTRLSREDLINSTSLIRVGKSGMSGYVNPSGQLVIDIQYDNTSPFSEGLAFVKKRDNTILCIDETGKTIFEIDSKYNAGWGGYYGYTSFSLGVFKNGMVTLVMIINGKSEFVHLDKTGEILPIKEK